MAAVRPSPNLSEIAGAGVIRPKPQNPEGLHETGDGRMAVEPLPFEPLGSAPLRFARGKDGFLDRAASTTAARCNPRTGILTMGTCPTGGAGRKME